MNKKQKEEKAALQAAQEKAAQEETQAAFDKSIIENISLMLYVALFFIATEKGKEIVTLNALPTGKAKPTGKQWNKFKRDMTAIRPKTVNFVLWHIAICEVANSYDQLGNSWQAMVNFTLFGIKGDDCLKWQDNEKALLARAKELHLAKS